MDIFDDFLLLQRKEGGLRCLDELHVLLLLEVLLHHESVVEVLLQLRDPRTLYVFKLEDPQQLQEGLFVFRVEFLHLLH